MTDKELNIRLREMARAAGLCDEWFSHWKDDDSIDVCLERAVRGFDFVQGNDYPPLSFIRENFGKEVLHRHHFYLDEEVSLKVERSGYYIFMGECSGSLSIDGFVAVTVYVRHSSRIDVCATGGARVFVTYYDDSSGECRQDGYSRCRKYSRKRVSK